MGNLRSIRFFQHVSRGVVLAVLCTTPFSTQAFAAKDVAPNSVATAKKEVAPPLLPVAFSGWVLKGDAKLSTDPAAADGTNAVPLKECGLTDSSIGTYNRDNQKLEVKALRFIDATGAFCAYTFYRHPGWPKEDIGRGASSANNRVLFWTGNVLVDANFDQVGPMSAAEMRNLAKELPTPSGNAALPPPLPSYLPATGLEAQSSHYALGVESYTKSGGVLPAALVDFTKGAEVLTANYHMHSGEGALTLIGYPTPQIAAERERAIGAFLKGGNSPQTPWTQALTESSPTALQVSRSGPFVAVTSGYFSTDDAKRILGSINYQAQVSWTQPTETEISKTAKLLLSVCILIGVLGGTAIVMGLFLGGGRTLYRRLRGKPATAMEEVEFIRLDLRK